MSRRRQYLRLADTQLFWFDARAEPEAYLELGVYLDSGKVVVGASPSLPDRAALAAQVSDGHPDIVLHDSLDLVIEVARADLRECAPKRLRLRGFYDDPDIAAFALSEALYELTPGPSLAWQVPELVAQTEHAAGQGITPVLLTRIFLVAERLRLDDTDPLAWTELHQAVDVLRRDYGRLPGFDYGPLSGLEEDELDDET